MGNNDLRRIFKSEQKYTDKTASKHKHNFNVHAVMRLRHGDNSVSYYDIMKCEHCNSFRAIPKEGAINGFIANNDYDKDLPMVKLYTSHKYAIGWHGAILDNQE